MRVHTEHLWASMKRSIACTSTSIKALKFGYGRATDHACEDIRLGVVACGHGKKLVRKYDLQPLGQDFISNICAFLEYSPDEFVGILERFRDTSIWKKDAQGQWMIPGHLEDDQ